MTPLRAKMIRELELHRKAPETINPCTGTTARPCLWLPRATANARPAQGLLARRKTRFFRRSIGTLTTSSGPLCRVAPCCFEPFRAATMVTGRLGGNSIRISESPCSREVGPVQRTIYPAEYSRIDRITFGRKALLRVWTTLQP